MLILVTGGAGYIGSHACIELLAANYDIIVIDDFSNSNPVYLKRVKELTHKDFLIYELNLMDRKGLETIFHNHQIDAVLHFAGYKAADESVRYPLKYYYNNVYGTVVLCDVMQKFGVKQIVFSSSATVYGTPQSVPITEASPLQAVNPYGRTKLIIEEMLKDIYISDPAWGISILRYFNPIGAHESGMIGEEPQGIPNNLMPYITQVAIGIREKLRIFGNDYHTHDGTAVRDYIHVVDLAKGHIKALQKLAGKSGIDTYNLGTGKGLSILELIRCFERVTHQRIPYVFADRRLGDIEQSFADASKANQELGWAAERNIEDMCRDSWNWQVNGAFRNTKSVINI